MPPRWDDQRDGVDNDPSFGRAGDDDFGGGAGAQGTSDNFSGGRGAYDDFSGGGGMQPDRNPDPGYDDFGGGQGGASQDYGDGAGAMYDDSSYGPDRGWQGGRDFDRDAYGVFGFQLPRQMMANLTTSQRADRDGFADDRSGWNDPYDFRDEFEDAQRPHERYYENERDLDRYDAAHERGRFEDQGEYPAWNNRRGPLMTKPSRR